jgi:hypothetical protein
MERAPHNITLNDICATFKGDPNARLTIDDIEHLSDTWADMARGFREETQYQANNSPSDAIPFATIAEAVKELRLVTDNTFELWFDRIRAACRQDKFFAPVMNLRMISDDLGSVAEPLKKRINGRVNVIMNSQVRERKY